MSEARAREAAGASAREGLRYAVPSPAAAPITDGRGRTRRDALTRAEQGGGVGERRDEKTEWRKLDDVHFGPILDAGILL